MQSYLHSDQFQAIIFDLDGTFYPRAIYVSTYYDFTLQSLCELLSLEIDAAKNLMKKYNISRDPSAEQGSVSTMMSKLGVSLRKWNSYRDSRFDLSSLINANDLLCETLSMLCLRYELTLITNNTRLMTDKILSKLGINKNEFAIIITSDDGMPTKPNLDSFQYIVKKLNLGSQGILSIGDRYEVDVEPVLILGGSGIVVDSPEDIIDLANDWLLQSSNVGGRS